MRILFLCGSLESGRDGVGDYTKKLALELTRYGHEVAAIGLNDNHIFDCYDENDSLYEHLNVVRLPSIWQEKKRFAYAKEWIRKYQPEWISLQFVIYSYHSKGLPFELSKLMSRLDNGAKWHIMFHEIWIGISKISPLKHKITGYFQRRIILSLTNALCPKLITTSNIVYQLVLKSAGIQSEILSLFSNISVSPMSKEIIAVVLKDLGISSNEDLKKWRLIGIFGNLYPEAELERVLNEQLLLAEQQDLNLAFISFGRLSNHGIEEFKRIEGSFHHKIKFCRLGELMPDDVSSLMQLLNAGISCTPEQHIGKSGVFAAMKLHGLDVIMSAQEVIPEYEEEINNYHKQFVKKTPDEWSAKNIAGQFIELLEKTE